MKNILLLLFILMVGFSSCSKNKNISSTNENVSIPATDSIDLMKIDSVRIQDSTVVSKTLTLAFEAKVLEFPNIKNKALLDSIYSQVNIKSSEYSKKNILDSLTLQKEKFYKEFTENSKDWKPEFHQTWDQNSDMKLFSKLNNFMIIQYTNNGFTGGAHGYYNEIYKVFDLGRKNTLQLNQIIKNPEEKIWTKILMNNFLKNDLKKGQAEMLLVKEIPLNNNFYFDKENLYFLYNQYEITAYAAGTVLVKIPYTEIKPLLTKDFRTALNL